MAEEKIKFLTLLQINAIMKNTFKEAIRSRIFYILMAFAIGMLGFAVVLSFLTLGSQKRVILDLGLAGISFFSVMTSIFVGIGLIYMEVEKKTIYNVLPKPMPRANFIIGRYFGLMAVLGTNLIAMLAILSLVLLCFKGFTLMVFYAGIFIFMELAIITAIAIFFSSVASPVLSALCTISFYIIGHTSSTFPDILVPILHSEFQKKMATALFHILPDLTILNVSNLITYEIPIAEGFVGRAFLYTVFMVSLLLLSACLCFKRRDLV
jgi:Cu-processing system permease protein